jgi:hypothetical protein
MAEARHYTGGCHCGAVRYELTAELTGAMACNCSICGKTGTLLIFVPGASFTLLSGEERLTDYLFNKQHIHHLFCSRCGIRSFARGNAPDGSVVVAVNVRCLDDVDPTTLDITHHDGKSA